MPLLVVAVAALWWLQAPPRSESSYREEAASTAEKLRSDVQTARLWSRARQNDRVFREGVTVALQESEHAAQSSASMFASHNPPEGLGPLRGELNALASDVTDALARLRIAAHRERWSELGTLSRPLPVLARKLEDFAVKAKP